MTINSFKVPNAKPIESSSSQIKFIKKPKIFFKNNFCITYCCIKKIFYTFKQSNIIYGKNVHNLNNSSWLNVLGQKNAFDDILDFLPIRNSCSSTAGSDENRAKKYNYEDFDIQDVSVTTCPISKKSYIFIIFNQSTTTISSLYSKNTSFILIYEIGKKGCIKVLNLSVKASFLEISKNLKSIYIGTFLGFVQEVDVSDLLGGGRKRVEEFSSHNSSDVFEPNTQDILVKSHQVTQTETTPVKNADSAHQNHSILNKFGSYFSNYLFGVG